MFQLTGTKIYHQLEFRKELRKNMNAMITNSKKKLIYMYRHRDNKAQMPLERSKTRSYKKEDEKKK